MRRQKTIQVGDEQVTVYEITPKEVVLILPVLKELFEKSFTEAELIDLFVRNYDRVKEVLVNCTSLKEKVLDYGMSYIVPIIRAFVEVNGVFFTEVKSQLTGEK